MRASSIRASSCGRHQVGQIGGVGEKGKHELDREGHPLAGLQKRCIIASDRTSPEVRNCRLRIEGQPPIARGRPLLFCHPGFSVLNYGQQDGVDQRGLRHSIGKRPRW